MKGLKTLRKFAKAPIEQFGEFASLGHQTVRAPHCQFHFIDDPHLAQRLLLNREFVHDPMVYDQLRPITGQSGMVQLTGAPSQDLRQRLRPLLTKEGLEVLEAIVDDELSRAIVEFGDDSQIAITELTYDLTWRINYRYICGDDRLLHSEGLFEAFKTISQICGRRMRQIFPLPAWMPTPETRELRRAREEVDRLLADVLASHSSDRLSVLSLLPKGEFARDQLTTLMWAGHETTASAIITSLHYLSLDPALQQRVRGNRQAATRVFKEAIRLHPPAYMLVRKLRSDTQIDDVEFRRGDHVVISLYNMHRRADLFPEPERFDPDRFQERSTHLGYLPFGLGPKRCFGEPISYFEASKIISDLTDRYFFSPGPNPLRFDTDVTLVPRSDFLLNAQRRSKGEYA